MVHENLCASDTYIKMLLPYLLTYNVVTNSKLQFLLYRIKAGPWSLKNWISSMQLTTELNRES